jgi:alpha-galactosidase
MEKIVLIGAGSAMFTRGMVTDMIKRRQECELALVDVDPEALKVAEKLAAKMIAAGKVPIKLSAATDRRAVLNNATVVICTIGVGGRRAWEQDVFIPRKYGIYQPVGDSVMPGGTSRALRMIPAMVDIAGDVLDLAPQALFFNYGNPMGAICRGVRKATGAKMTGLCHGVMSAALALAAELGVDSKRFSYNAMGMNHCTWLTEARVDGRDAMPDLAKIAGKKLKNSALARQAGAKFQEDGSAAGGERADSNPFCWRLMELFGAFPFPGDRHVTEFFPSFFPQGSYYGKKLGVDAFSFERCIAYGDRIYNEMREVALSAGPLAGDYFQSIPGEHEQVFDIIDSIRTGAGRVFSANLPNRGQIPNLPPDVIVELPAVADGSGLHSEIKKPLPAGVAGTLATRLMWQETVVEAALEGSREKFIQALVLDGAVNSIETAVSLADELLAAHAEHLPQFKMKDKKI